LHVKPRLGWIAEHDRVLQLIGRARVYSISCGSFISSTALILLMFLPSEASNPQTGLQC
jgi:hypothetical protein